MVIWCASSWFLFEGQQISWSRNAWTSEPASFEVSFEDSYTNMLFIYKLHISQSQHLQKQCQKNDGVGYNTPLLHTCLLPLFSLSTLILFISFIKIAHHLTSNQATLLCRGLEIYFHLRVKSWFVVLPQPCPYVTGKITRVVSIFLDGWPCPLKWAALTYIFTC